MVCTTYKCYFRIRCYNIGIHFVCLSIARRTHGHPWSQTKTIHGTVQQPDEETVDV